MKTKSLPSVEEVYETTLTKEDNVSIPNLLTQDRNQAYTSLVEGIEGMKWGLPRGSKKRADNQILTDIIEKVVKPLYGKKALDNTPPNKV